MRVLLRVFVIGTLSAAVPLGLVAIPREGEAVLVFAPLAPHGAIGVMAAADGRLVTPGRSPALAVAISGEPLFITRLYRAGATLVVSARMAAACGLTPWRMS